MVITLVGHDFSNFKLASRVRAEGEEYDVIIQGPTNGKALDECRAFAVWWSSTPLDQRSGELIPVQTRTGGNKTAQ